MNALQKYWFAGTVAALVLFKLWLVHAEEIFGESGAHAGLWYLRSAKSWYWGADSGTVLRPPIYPLFIATVHVFGIPLRVSVELIQSAGYIALVAAIRRLHVPRWICLSILVALVLHPASFQINNHIDSSGLYCAVLCLCLAALICTLVTLNIWWGAATGFAFFLLWNTRSPDFLIPIVILASAGIAFLRNWNIRSAGKITPAFVSMAIAAIMPTSLLYGANYWAFGEHTNREIAFQNSKAHSPSFPKSITRTCRLFFQRYELLSDRQDATLRSNERALYDEMAGLRAPLTRLAVLRIVGWAFRYGDPLLLVAYDSGNGEIESAISQFGASPNVVKNFSSQGSVPLFNEFGLPIIVRRSVDPDGSVIFVMQSGRRFVASAKSLLAGNAPTENGAPDGEELHCQIFAREFTPTVTTAAVGVENFIGKYYRDFTIALLWFGFAAFSALTIYWGRLQLDDLNILLILLAVTITSHILLVGCINATSWGGQDVRYLFPVMPLLSAFLILLIYQAARCLMPTVPAKIDN